MYSKVTSVSTLIVDPNRDGLSALLVDIVGTLAVTGSIPNIKYRAATCEAIVRSDLKYANVEFEVNIPLTGVQTPTDLTADISFGLENISLGNKGKMRVLLDQSANVIQLEVYDNDGVIIETIPFDYDVAWNDGEDVRFIFIWENDRVALKVKNATGEVRELASVRPDDTASISRYALNPFIKATGADNFDVNYIHIDNADTISIAYL